MALKPTGQKQTTQIERQAPGPAPKAWVQTDRATHHPRSLRSKRFAKTRRQKSPATWACVRANTVSGAHQTTGRHHQDRQPPLTLGLVRSGPGGSCASSPTIALCKKWGPQIPRSKIGAGRRKQLILALARGFGVDWLAAVPPASTTAEKLGLPWPPEKCFLGSQPMN